MTNSGWTKVGADRGGGLEYVAQPNANDEAISIRVDGEVYPRVVLAASGAVLIGDGTVAPSHLTGETSWYTGIVAPSDSMGTNGDFFLLVTAGVPTAIYQKLLGTWVLTGTFFDATLTDELAAEAASRIQGDAANYLRLTRAATVIAGQSSGDTSVMHSAACVFHDPSSPSATLAQGLEQVTGVVGATSSTVPTQAGFDVMVPRANTGYETPSTFQRANPNAKFIKYLISGAVEQLGSPGSDVNHPATSFVYPDTSHATSPSPAVTLNGDPPSLHGGTANDDILNALVSHKGTPDTYLMRMFRVDVGHVGEAVDLTSVVPLATQSPWVAYLATKYGGLVSATKGWSGVMPDVFGILPAGNKQIEDPAVAGTFTPHAYNGVSWFDANGVVGLAVAADEAITAALPVGVTLTPNGIVDGINYFSGGNTRRHLSTAGAAAGGYCERFLRLESASATAWPHYDSTVSAAQNRADSITAGVNCWIDDVNMVLDAEANGWSIICGTKYWPSGHVNTIAESKQWFRLSLCSYLLGAAGKCSHAYRHDNNSDTALAGDTITYSVDVGPTTAVEFSLHGHHRWYSRFLFGDGTDNWVNQLRLGVPSETLAALTSTPNYHGVYARQYSSGIVLVNPSSSDVTGVTLPAGTYVDMDGTSYSGTATVPAHSGLALSLSPTPVVYLQADTITPFDMTAAAATAVFPSGVADRTLCGVEYKAGTYTLTLQNAAAATLDALVVVGTALWQYDAPTDAWHEFASYTAIDAADARYVLATKIDTSAGLTTNDNTDVPSTAAIRSYIANLGYDITSVRTFVSGPTPAHVQHASGAGTPVPTATFASPTTVGNLLFASVEIQTTGAAGVAAPSGWTACGSSSASNSTSVYFFYKVADGTETLVTPGTPATTVAQATILIAEFSGIDGTPYAGETVAHSDTAVTSITAGAFTTAGGSHAPAAGDLIIEAVGLTGTAGSAPTFTLSTVIAALPSSGANTRTSIAWRTAAAAGHVDVDGISWTTSRTARTVISVFDSLNTDHPAIKTFTEYDTASTRAATSVLPSASTGDALICRLAAGTTAATITGDHFDSTSGASTYTLSVVGQTVLFVRAAAGYWATFEGNALSALDTRFAAKSGTLAQFAATTSAQLASVISDETGSGALVFANSPTFTGTLTIPATGSGAFEPATKAYADAVAQGLSLKGSAFVATTANVTLSGEQTIDGQLTSASRVLVKNQTAGAENGLYVTGAGAWTRTTDMDANSEVVGAFVFVEAGTVNASSGWVVTNTGAFTVGTTAMTWTQFSGAGEITAGTGLAKSGNTLSIDTATTVDKTTAQTLANKTATSLILNTGVSGTAIDTDSTFAANSDSLLASQKATKTALALKANLASPAFTGTPTVAGATSGTIGLVATAIAGSNTLTLPAATDTLIGKATTDTLTNKTFGDVVAANAYAMELYA